jgi:hypothetical protein
MCLVILGGTCCIEIKEYLNKSKSKPKYQRVLANDPNDLELGPVRLNSA